MGCNYKIYGSITLRRSPEVDALLEALRERLDDGAVEVEELDENTIDLALNFDDATTIHTPPAMAELFKRMAPFAIGAGSFDIETSGERWTEYIGTPEEVAKTRSMDALHLIQEHIGLLTAEDRAKLGMTGQVIAPPGGTMQTNAQRYIVEISGFEGSEVSVFIQDGDGQPLYAHYAIVLVDVQGASIVDSGYRSIAEAKTAWPEAKEPGGNHLTPSAADERAIPGVFGSPKLSP